MPLDCLPPSGTLPFRDSIVMLAHRPVCRAAAGPFHITPSKASSGNAYCWRIWLAPYDHGDILRLGCEDIWAA